MLSVDEINKLKQENEAYKQTLQEIKELINSTCWDYTDITIIPIKDKILDLITKAEEE